MNIDLIEKLDRYDSASLMRELSVARKDYEMRVTKLAKEADGFFGEIEKLKKTPPKVTVEIVVKSEDGNTVERYGLPDAIPFAQALPTLAGLTKQAAAGDLLASNQQRVKAAQHERDVRQRNIQSEAVEFDRVEARFNAAIAAAKERETQASARDADVARHVPPPVKKRTAMMDIRERLGIGA